MADIPSFLRIPDGNGNVRVIGSAPGKDGEDGVGVPPGGTTGQILAKNSNTNYDAEWIDPAASTAPAQNQKLSIKTISGYAGGAISLTGPAGSVSVTPGTQNAQAIADALEATYAAGAVIMGSGASTGASVGSNLALNAPVLASSEQSGGGRPATMAVDGITGSNYGNAWISDTAAPHWLRIDLSSAQTIASYRLWGTIYQSDPRSWVLAGSNTGAFSGEQTALDTRTGVTLAEGFNDFAIASPAAFRYYRIYVSDTSQSGQPVAIVEIQLLTATNTASLDTVLDLGGTLAGTNPALLTTTTTGVKITLLQVGTSQGDGATQNALNTVLALQQAQSSTISTETREGYFISGSGPLSGSSASSFPGLVGVPTDGFYHYVSPGLYKLGDASDNYYTLKDVGITDPTSLQANYYLIIGVSGGSSTNPYQVLKDGSGFVPSSGWQNATSSGTTPPTSAKYQTGTGVFHLNPETSRLVATGITAGKINTNGANLTALQVVETDAAGLFISAAKGDAYNKSFGTAAGTIAQGNDSRLSNNARTNAANTFTGANTFTAADTTTISDAVTGALTIVRTHGHNSSATPVAGFGLRERFQLKSSTTNNRDVGYLDFQWVTATDGSRAARGVLSAVDFAGTREGFRFEANGSASAISFFGANAITKPTVTGSRSDGTALASLLTALANLGLITNSTTA